MLNIMEVVRKKRKEKNIIGPQVMNPSNPSMVSTYCMIPISFLPRQIIEHEPEIKYHSK